MNKILNTIYRRIKKFKIEDIFLLKKSMHGQKVKSKYDQQGVGDIGKNPIKEKAIIFYA